MAYRERDGFIYGCNYVNCSSMAKLKKLKPHKMVNILDGVNISYMSIFTLNLGDEA